MEPFVIPAPPIPAIARPIMKTVDEGAAPQHVDPIWILEKQDCGDENQFEGVESIGAGPDELE
jgi:hypothetical protein